MSDEAKPLADCLPKVNVNAPLKNEKWERFAQGLAEGLTCHEAYAQAGYTPNAGNATRLKLNEAIQARVAALLAAMAHKVTVSKAWVLEKLVANVERAMQHEVARDKDGNEIGDYQYQGQVANRALELLGKEIGMFVERKEIGVPGEFKAIEEMNAAELRAFARAEAKALGLRLEAIAEGGGAGEAGEKGRLN